MNQARIVRIEWAPLVGERPRAAGGNAFSGPHGLHPRVPVARVSLDDGGAGFGWSRLDRGTAQVLLGAAWSDAFQPSSGVAERFRPIEAALWDLAGRRASTPVYGLAAAILGAEVPSGPVRVPCYDTTLYFDDLHLADDEAGAALMADEARQGWAAGHRAFKIKVGRGNLHLPTADGFRRDVAVVKAIRRAVGPDAPILTDANNGYTYNLAREFLAATADCNVFWLEEAFYEDALMYRRLRAWLDAEGLATLIADGENRALVDPTGPIGPGVNPALLGARWEPSTWLMEMAREGIVDVLQYDVFVPGLTRLLAINPDLAAWGRTTAPHHYGTHLGNYVGAHFGAVARAFGFVEWDEARTPGIAAPGYRIVDGCVEVPPTPGFGLELDEDLFLSAVRTEGFTVAA